MTPTKITAGMIVINPLQPRWGPGKVVKATRESAWVLWRDAEGGEVRKMALAAVRLEPAPSQTDPLLDNLPPLLDANGEPRKLLRRLTLAQARARFLGYFPGGFYDPKYLGDQHSGERNYKEQAHKECVERLGNGRYAHLLSSDRRQLAEGVRQTCQSVNLLSQYEQMRLAEILREESSASRFLEALGRVVESDDVSRETFEPYLHAVRDLPAQPSRPVGTWPVATIVPFLLRPDRHMFLKPMVTEAAVEALGFELNYESSPNWLTYSRLLAMGRIYMEHLTDLKPRDMIDVQSFFWVTCGGYGRE